MSRTPSPTGGQRRPPLHSARKSPCRAGSMCPAVHRIPCHASGGVLSANSGRKYPKNAVKTHGFEILCAAGVPSVWKAFCHANEVRKVIALPSYRLCVYSRWPLTRARAGLARRGRLLRLPGGGVWAPRLTHNLKAGAGGASGKSAKRRQWWKKRADFEEVPRLAATTVAGNRLARRWAGASGCGQNWGRPP